MPIAAQAFASKRGPPGHLDGKERVIPLISPLVLQPDLMILRRELVPAGGGDRRGVLKWPYENGL